MFKSYLHLFSTISNQHISSSNSTYLRLEAQCGGLLPCCVGTFLAHSAVCTPSSHSPVCVCVCPCLPSLLGHDECSPISTVQAAGRKGKQTQQATVVDLFIRPQSSSQASAPCPGPDSQTSKSRSPKKNTDGSTI